MQTQYPPNVDIARATIGGLPIASHFVNYRGMAKADPEFPEIAARLMALRKRTSDLDQKQWAEKHGFGITQYNNWEKGVRRIPVENAEKLCAVYGLTLDFIYRGRRDGLAENISKLL